MIKAVLLDFDGTLVNKDILDVICGIVGREQESELLNRRLHAGELKGLTPLITRINFLKGVSLAQIDEKLNENAYLVSGAEELMSYLNQNKIITILNSGNIIPVLSYYKKLLGLTYIIGTHPKMDGDTILGIDESDFSGGDFKVIGVKKLLEELSILPEHTLAIGDSPVDKTMFEFAGKSIAINPKNGVEKYEDFIIKDLSEAVEIIDKLNR